MIQIHTIPVFNSGQANEVLRDYPRLYPKRKIMSVSMVPVEFPGGWFMIVTYEVNL